VKTIFDLECGDSSPLFRLGDWSPRCVASRLVAAIQSGDKSPHSKQPARSHNERAPDG
jgi:hypothetical protein